MDRLARPYSKIGVVTVQALYLRELFHDDVAIIGEPKEDHVHPLRRRLARWFRAAKR